MLSEMKVLQFKTALLLVLVCGKRAGDMQALSKLRDLYGVPDGQLYGKAYPSARVYTQSVLNPVQCSGYNTSSISPS